MRVLSRLRSSRRMGTGTSNISRNLACALGVAVKHAATPMAGTLKHVHEKTVRLRACEFQGITTSRQPRRKDKSISGAAPLL